MGVSLSDLWREISQLPAWSVIAPVLVFVIVGVIGFGSGRSRKKDGADYLRFAALLSGGGAMKRKRRELLALEPARASALLRSTSALRLAEERTRRDIDSGEAGDSRDIRDVIHELMIRRIAQRQNLIATIERRNGSRVIAIVHGRDRGFEGRRSHVYFDMETADELISVLRTVPPDQPIDIILHTPGGLVYAGLQIAEALKAHPGRKTAFVPFHAYSMGTIVALVADKIVMGPNAVLGPIDVQFGNWPGVDLLRLRKEKAAGDISDEYTLLSYLAERAVREDRNLCDLVNANHKQDGTCTLTTRLASGELSHAYPIGVSDARGRGIDISTNMPKEIYEFVELCRDIDTEPAVRFIDSP